MENFMLEPLICQKFTNDPLCWGGKYLVMSAKLILFYKSMYRKFYFGVFGCFSGYNLANSKFDCHIK